MPDPYAIDLEHGWGDDESQQRPAAEWLKVSPGEDRKDVVILSTEAEVIRYMGHWHQALGEFRRCNVPHFCSMCRTTGKQRRFVLAVWWGNTVWRWEIGDVQAAQIRAIQRQTGGELRGLGLGLWRMRGKSPIQVEALGPGEAAAPSPLPDAPDLDPLMWAQWARQSLRQGKGNGAPAGEVAAMPPASSSAPNRLPRPARPSTPDSGNAAPPSSPAPEHPSFVLDYHAKHGRWPPGFNPEG